MVLTFLPADARMGVPSWVFPSFSAQWYVCPVEPHTRTQEHKLPISEQQSSISQRLCCKKETRHKNVHVVCFHCIKFKNRKTNGHQWKFPQWLLLRRSRKGHSGMPTAFSLVGCFLDWHGDDMGTCTVKHYRVVHIILDHVTQFTAWMVNLGKRALKNYLLCI